MADLDIQKVKFYDSRVVQNKPSYLIQESNLATTNTSFRAISYTQSTLNFNINTPSLSVFIDRKLPISATVNMQITATAGSNNLAAGDTVCIIGKDLALAPYPLHSMFNSVQVSINDSVVSSQVADHLYEVARMTDLPENRVQRTTPTLLDTYAKYSDAALANNNPLGGYHNTPVETHEARGAFSGFTFCNSNGNVVQGAMGGSSNCAIDAYGNCVAGAAGIAAGAPIVFYCQFSVTEYLQVSPFIFNEQESDPTALFGVQNLQILCNIGSPARVIRLVQNAATEIQFTQAGVAFNTTGGTPFQGQPECNVTFITSPISLSLPERSVVPYMEYNVFQTTNSQVLGAQNLFSPYYTNNVTITSNTIVLSQVPDYLVIWCKPAGQNGVDLGDFYCPISKLNILFDNYSGLMSSFNQEKLYEMTFENALRMGWSQFRGIARVASTGANDHTLVPLSGCPLVLQMGKDITMSSGLAAGVLAQLSLQVTATCNSTIDQDVTPNLYIMPINSGYCVTQAGQTMVIKAPLTEQDVISAPTGRVLGRKALGRYVGGSLFDNISSAVGKVRGVWDSLPSGVKDMVKEGVAMGTDKLADMYAPEYKGTMQKLRKAAIGKGPRTGAGRKNKKVSLEDLM